MKKFDEKLEAITLTTAERSEIQANLKSWGHIGDFLNAQTDELPLLKMLKLCLEEGRGIQVILRIKQRYNRLHTKRTNKEMFNYWGGIDATRKSDRKRAKKRSN